MLAINVFVLPIAFGGRMHFAGGNVDADTFVLTLPMAEKRELLALLVFIGGLSAATGMVIVETMALSLMVCNDLVMPVLLRLRRLRLNKRRDLTRLLLGIRRGAIVLILLLGYLYFRLAGEAYALVSIGLISFAAVAQFAPVALGGIFWKGGTRRGALCGLVAGFAVWFYTLLLPALARSGWVPISLLERGPFGIELLQPLQLFGLSGLDQITHAMIWSLVANIGAYLGVSPSAAPSVGVAPGRGMVGSVGEEEALTIDEVREILGGASQVVVYSHRLEQKSRELEAATAGLREANERLKELDRLKDDFVSTVTHELRTPLTSIRAFTEILLDDPDVEIGQRKTFLGIITKEAERLTRLINQVLDLAKIESGKAEWVETRVDMKEVISDTLAAMDQLFREKNIEVEARLPEKVSTVTVDLDRMIKVMLNLLSNAVKFCDSSNGKVEIALAERDGFWRVDVRE